MSDHSDSIGAVWCEAHKRFEKHGCPTPVALAFNTAETDDRNLVHQIRARDAEIERLREDLNAQLRLRDQEIDTLIDERNAARTALASAQAELAHEKLRREQAERGHEMWQEQVEDVLRLLGGSAENPGDVPIAEQVAKKLTEAQAEIERLKDVLLEIREQRDGD